MKHQTTTLRWFEMVYGGFQDRSKGCLILIFFLRITTELQKKVVPENCVNFRKLKKRK